jgi:hypothetical protein
VVRGSNGLGILKVIKWLGVVLWFLLTLVHGMVGCNFIFYFFGVI